MTGGPLDGSAPAASTGTARSPLRAVAPFLVQRFASGFANQVQAVAVGWYVYALTGSALDLGLVGLAQFVPTLGLALVAGHAVDRYPRRNIMLASVALEFACYAGLAALTLSGNRSVVPVFVVVAGLGVVRAFNHPAQSSLLPTLVAPPVFPRVVAWSAGALQSAVVIGPTAGGLLYLFGAPVPFLVAAALSAASFAAIAALPAHRGAPAPAPQSWQRVLSGIHFIRNHQAVLGAITLDLFGVLFGGATALLPIYARDILMIGAPGLGLLRSAPAVGALVTAAALTRWPLTRHVGPRILVTVAAYGAATVVFGLSTVLPLSFVALIAVGAADMVSVVTRNTLVQTSTPDSIRGRVSAVNTVFIGTSNQLGEFESGAVAAWLGPVASVVLGGAVTVAVAALWAWRFPALRMMDRFERIAE